MPITSTAVATAARTDFMREVYLLLQYAVG